MEIGYISNILVEIGGLCLAAAGMMTMYYVGFNAGKKDAIKNFREILQDNADESGICKIQTNIKD